MRSWGIKGFLALLPLAAAVGANAAPPLQTLAGLAGAPWRQLSKIGRRNAPWLLAVLVFLAWLSASAFWSTTADAPIRALKLWGMAGSALLFAAAAAAQSSSLRPFLWIAALALAGLCALEVVFGLPLNRLLQPEAVDMVKLGLNPGRGVAILTLLHFPALLAARKRWWAMAVLSVATAWLSLQFDLSANAVALAAGWLAFAFAFATPALGLWVAGVVWASWLIVGVRLIPRILERLPEALPLSWRARTGIWDYAVARIEERPLFGWGFEASRSFEGSFRVNDLVVGNIPLHPHSASLQIWLELGGVGAVLAAGVCLLAMRSAMRRLGGDRFAAAAAAGLAAVAFVLLNVSFGAWQEWFWAAAATAAAALAAVAPPRQSKAE